MPRRSPSRPSSPTIPTSQGRRRDLRDRGGAPLTPLELRIMKVLWESPRATVQQVKDRLAEDGGDLAYNTVQTMLNVLLRKKRVRRTLAGRAYAYAPTTSRLQAARQAVEDLVGRMFDGSPESLVMSLVETRQLSSEKLAELSDMIEKARGGRGERD